MSNKYQPCSLDNNTVLLCSARTNPLLREGQRDSPIGANPSIHSFEFDLFFSSSAMVTTSVVAITMTTVVIRENPQLGPTLPLLIKEHKREDV